MYVMNVVLQKRVNSSAVRGKADWVTLNSVSVQWCDRGDVFVHPSTLNK